jgi:hypothetical protein
MPNKVGQDHTPNKVAGEVPPRTFNPTSIPGLSNQARDAVNAAFEAMSAWRKETVETSEKHSKLVIGKMATAAAALGWPGEIVDAARTQMESVSEMHIQAIDHIMNAWEQQLKLPNPMTASPSAMLSQLKSLPGFGPSRGLSSANALAGMNPFQFWTQMAEQWQNSWTNAMTFWSRAGNGKIKTAPAATEPRGLGRRT